MSPIGKFEDQDLAEAVALLAERIADALNDFAESVRRPAVRNAADEPELRRRQRDILEVEDLATSDGLNVSRISEAIGADDANTHAALRALERRDLVELAPASSPQHWRLSPSARRRRRVWHRSELILALDLYLRADGQPVQEDLEKTRALLDAWALHYGHRPRPMAGLVFKLANLQSLATGGAEGFSHGGARDAEVWEEFATQPARLAQAVEELKRELDA